MGVEVEGAKGGEIERGLRVFFSFANVRARPFAIRWSLLSSTELFFIFP
jgi:hypothetical protein